MKKIILCALLAAVLALMPFAGMAASEPVVMLAGIDMYPGDVLHCTNTMVGFPLENPTGYAEVSADGKTLTLHNFDNNGFYGLNNAGQDSSLIVYSPVTLNLQGQNKLSNEESWGEGITMHGDMTIQGTGSLEIDADWGIFNRGAGNLAITSGNLTIKGQYDNITTDKFTITGGKVDLTSENYAGIVSNYDLTISGGEVNIQSKDANFSYEDVIISGGEVNIRSAYALAATDEMQLTGGKMTLTYDEIGLTAKKIICTLPIPEGVEIRSIGLETMDYTDFLDRVNSDRWYPQWRTFQLIGQTAAPSVPTTGDNANLALWAALAVMSAAAMLVIRRRRSV